MNIYGLIILNYNSADDTIACVNKLLSFNKGYHIIIVDNNSSDNSVIRIENEFNNNSCIDIICNKKNGGYSAGNNIGIKYAIEKYNANIVGILNPDVIIPGEDVIEKIADVLIKDKSVAIASGISINAKGEYLINNSCWNIPSAMEIVSNHFFKSKRKQKAIKLTMCSGNAAYTECVAGCFFLAKATVIEEMGYLDENVFLYNEENILGIKCRNLGYKEAIVLDQFYVHNHIWKDERKKPIAKRLKMLDIGYKSRKYLCQTYYGKYMIPFLAIANFFNKLIIIFSSIKTMKVFK